MFLKILYSLSIGALQSDFAFSEFCKIQSFDFHNNLLFFQRFAV